MSRDEDSPHSKWYLRRRRGINRQDWLCSLCENGMPFGRTTRGWEESLKSGAKLLKNVWTTCFDDRREWSRRVIVDRETQWIEWVSSWYEIETLLLLHEWISLSRDGNTSRSVSEIDIITVLSFLLFRLRKCEKVEGNEAEREGKRKTEISMIVSARLHQQHVLTEKLPTQAHCNSEVSETSKELELRWWNKEEWSRDSPVRMISMRAESTREWEEWRECRVRESSREIEHYYEQGMIIGEAILEGNRLGGICRECCWFEWACWRPKSDIAIA